GENVDLLQVTFPGGTDGGVKGRGDDPLVLGQQVIGKLMKVTDSTDHGCPGQDLVAFESEPGQKRDVLGVTLDQPVSGMAVVAFAQGTVLAEVVDADDLVPGSQQLFDQVAADEAGGPGDEDLHAVMPRLVKPQMSTSSLPSSSSSR